MGIIMKRAKFLVPTKSSFMINHTVNRFYRTEDKVPEKYKVFNVFQKEIDPFFTKKATILKNQDFINYLENIIWYR